jgi:hypothetical protein
MGNTKEIDMKIALYQLVGYITSDAGTPCDESFEKKKDWIRVSEFVEVDFPMLENVDYEAAKIARNENQIAELEEKLKKLKGD